MVRASQASVSPITSPASQILFQKKRDSSHGNRDKEGRVGMSSFKSSSSSSGEREAAVEVAEMSASAGGKRAGMKLRMGRREGINKQTWGRKRSSPPGFDPPPPPHQRQTPPPPISLPPPAARRCEGGEDGDFTGVTSQGKQFHRRRVLLQEPPFGKFGPLG